MDRENLETMLNEEKWTRATLNSYTINNFKDLDEIINTTISEKSEKEIVELCDEHLGHTKNSIIALYISGIFSLMHQLVDDSNIVTIIEIFSDNHKWNIVEYLCERILEFGENKFALRTLAECYGHENEDEKQIPIWERLIKVDYEETEIVKQLAEIKEEAGDIPNAIDYYKKAIHRFLNKKLFNQVKDIWTKLVEYCPEETDFFFHIDKKIATILSGDRASQLLEELFEHYKKNSLHDKGIEILKRILDYDSKNVWARKEITACYKEQYSYHSLLDEYIRLSNLSQSWRNVHDAISDFEKHISFDAGNFVFHRSWGIGRISSIHDDEIIIDFAKKRNHKMSLKMAISALTSLAKDHIWVLKVISKREELKKLIKSNVPWALKTIIKSYNNSANMKKIKAELVPSVLTQGEWSSWSTEARKILKTDSSFGNLPDQMDIFVVRDIPISFEEKTFNKFKAEKNFFGKVSTIFDFIEHSDPESEYFSEMFLYFTNFLKAFNAVNEVIITSYLVVMKIVKKFPFLNPGLSFNLIELIEKTEDIVSVFAKIEDNDIKRAFLENLKDSENWDELFVKLFPIHLSKYIIDELLAKGHNDKVKVLFGQIMDNYRDNKEAFIWLGKNIETKEQLEEYDINYEKILINMIHILDITYREISNRKDVSFNRKLNRQINTFLFKENKLEDYIMEIDEDSINRLYTLMVDVKELDPSIIIDLKQKIAEKFPKFKFYVSSSAPQVKEVAAKKGLMVTEKLYKQKQKDLRHIIEVEIPENSKEIGAAIELGDLKENAEYKAGKEKQELLNITVGKLKDEIERATIVKPEKVNTKKVSFGTIVKLKNKDTKKDETYTFLGPWESDPDNNIISYLSPFGTKLWNKKAKSEVTFTINDTTYNYVITSIKAADF